MQIPIPNSLYLTTEVSFMLVSVLITKSCLIIKGILKIHYDQCIMGENYPVKIRCTSTSLYMINSNQSIEWTVRLEIYILWAWLAWA